MIFTRFHTILLFITGVFFGIFFHAFIGAYDGTKISSSTGSEIFSSKKIQEVQSIIQKEYYHFSEKTKQEIEDGMITSLVESLGDKHSSYFPPKEAKEFSEVLRGDFEGIGAVIDEHIKGIILRKVFNPSPAKKAGLQDGDILLEVGGVSLLGMSSEDAVKKIRGPKGSKVTLVYQRGDDENRKSIEVTRDTIVIPSVQAKMLTGSVGYIEVAFFGERTTEEFRKSLDEVVASGATSLLLDFRNNGGGYLDTAVDVLSLLLPDDSRAVTTRENDPTRTMTLTTRKITSTNTTIPIVMLINNLSASATEIVAGALQDHGRAIIVGEKSYGKGSVQEPFLLNDGSMLKITIGRWYTPNDMSIDKNGITPDVLVPLYERDFRDQYDRQIEHGKEILETLRETPNDRQKVIDTMKQKDFTK